MTEKQALKRWLWLWGYLVVTLVAPLALGAAGIWPWDLAMGIASAFWVVAVILMTITQAARSDRKP